MGVLTSPVRINENVVKGDILIHYRLFQYFWIFTRHLLLEEYIMYYYVILGINTFSVSEVKYFSRFMKRILK